MQTNKILRNTIIGGIFLLPFICLVVSNGFFFPFITGKNFMFRIIVEVIAGLWIILAVRDHESLPKSSRILQSFAIFIGLIFISDLLSPNSYKSFWSNYERMEGWVTMVHLFTLFVVMTSVMTKKLWEKLFNVSIGVSLILFLYGALQLTGQFDIHQGATRIDTTIGNSAYLGGYMLFHIFLSLYMLFVYFKRHHGLHTWRKFWPIFYCFAIGADIFVLFASATRGAEIGFIAGIVCVSIGLVVLEKENKILKRIGAGILIAIVLFGGALIVERKSDFVKHHESLARLGSFVDQFLTFDKKVICEGELKSRCLLWPMAFKGVKERPVFGWGQESFNYVFNKYYDPRMYGQEQWFDRTHNVFFDWLISGGILGLLSYLSLFGFALYHLWKKGGHFSPMESCILSGLFIGYFLHNFTVFDNITSYIMFVMVLSFIGSTSGNVIVGLENKIKSIDEGVKNRLIIPLVAVAIIFIVYKVNVPPMLASTELIQALRAHSGGPSVNIESFNNAFSYGSFGDYEIREQLYQATAQVAGNPGVDPKIKNALLELTQKQIEIQSSLTPDDARYFLIGGSALASYGDFDNAIKLLSRAHEISPNKQTILFSLGSAYLGKKDFANAVAVMKQAFELEPSYDEARRIYALALIYSRQFGLADEILKSISPEGVAFDQRLTNAYFAVGLFEKTLASINLLISREPNNPQLYFNRANVEFAMGRTSSSVADLRKVIEINPGAKGQIEPLIEQVRAGKAI